MPVAKKTTKKETTKKAVKKTVAKKTTKKEDSKEDIKAKLLAKAKELAGEVKDVEEVKSLKKQVKDDEADENLLVPIEDYLKASVHLGTKVITPDMKKYVYRRRNDGLAVFNTTMLDEELAKGAEYLAKFAPEDIIVVCKREAGWIAVDKFSEVTGIKKFTKKYPAGILTNPNLDDFIETKLVLICDPWLDKNALNDSRKIGIPVLAVCDTNNYTAGITQIIPGNNKSFKSLGIIFYLLTKLYVEARKMDVEVPQIQEFVEGWDELQPPK